jgi:hypothetical protein
LTGSELDVWVEHYNHDRPHQGIGMVPPVERFRLAQAEPSTIELTDAAPDTTDQPPVARRRVSSNGRVSFASTYYLAGVWLAGETVEVICDGGVVHLEHRGVRVASHARRHKPAKESAAVRRGQQRRPRRAATPRPSASSASVTRKVDSSGNVSFAGTNYRVGGTYRRRQVQVAVVADTVEISIGEELRKGQTVTMDARQSIAAVWNRIKEHEGEFFRQKRGAEFTYVVEGSSVRPDRTNRLLPRSDFERALDLVPLEGPGQIQHLQGPSYVYAILMDERIRGDEW